ncbi:hypothetical protein, partial [Clostridium bowmanii]|uniref:hypothetical protein n=1 Tax=Clostridium bowmanii TaxID=132925 RepID=UPI001C0B37ED
TEKVFVFVVIWKLFRVLIFLNLMVLVYHLQLPSLGGTILSNALFTMVSQNIEAVSAIGVG